MKSSSVRRIILLTGNPLCHNPRVLKEADALADCGIEVEVLGSETSPAYRQRDEKLAAGKRWKFIGLMSDPSAVEKIISRAQRYLGNQAHRWLGWENRWQLGPMAQLLWKEAKKRVPTCTSPIPRRGCGRRNSYGKMEEVELQWGLVS